MNRSIFYYGTLAGILLTIYVTMLDASKIIYTSIWGAYLGYLAILILPVVLFFALRQHVKETKRIVFKHFVLICLLISLTTATVYNMYSLIDNSFFDSRQQHNYLEFTKKEMIEAGNSLDEVAQKIEKMKAHYLSYKAYMGTYIWYVAFGLIYTPLFFFLFRIKHRKPILKN